MKKTTLILFAGLVLFMSSYSFEAYAGSPAYSGQNKMAKSSKKTQIHYAKRNVRKYGVISSIL